MAKSFNDLIVFKLAVALAHMVYDLTAEFPRDERFGLTSQMRRAAVGVFSQIAEGNGRVSYGEWRQFLSQARGSLFEIEAQAVFAASRDYIDEADLVTLKRMMRRVSQSIIGLLDWIAKQERTKDKRALTSSARGEL
jgi:four helix bundle protein